MVAKTTVSKKSTAGKSTAGEPAASVKVLEDSMKTFMVNRSQKAAIINFRVPEQLVERMDNYLDREMGGNTRGSRSAFLLKLIERYLDGVGA